MIYDSTFFVALDRERRKQGKGAAHTFLATHASDEVGMSVITKGELARGFLKISDWENFCSGFEIYPLTEEILWRAAEIFRDLRSRGKPTGENDLWIAATALVNSQVLVTQNLADFAEIPGLQIVTHAAPG